ncbi:transcription elongation factor A N-terminal and central domain-containing protein [Phascolarctos cinereus]|uniref:Transcription elongation factor A N-terminal and central domain-containing protein n=1 Tax=Phascolarctos cinereus TaxID=38626 RepID=A0A6P5LXC0_PHACI|nr:transcription elongation factor A N-terminal and central domain-containing protein [Phascolarctos cinereus]XP_020863158.1 transcription elongation factor A N-terminal and central domain-containing protein [Phascolarctos cinereus]XP_020863159.1 transcription elongation factor A N-terminal and central domain-containing protein [Phascolarctos cinereus]
MSDKTKKKVATRASIIEQLLTEKNFQDLGDHLTELETIHMSIEHLQETGVVRAVYRVLKHCPIVIFKKKAKCLLSKWKTLYKNHYFQPMNSSDFYLEDSKENTEHVSLVQEENSPYPSKEQILDTVNSNSMSSSQDNAKGVETFVPENSAAQVEEHSEEHFMNHDAKSIDSKSPWHQDPMRAKCIELLYGALVTCATDQEKTDRWQILAREIEEYVFALYSKNLKKYKNCIRSKVSNLKNRKNPHLQQNLFSGTLSPKEFAEMTIMEMANDELKQLRASYTESCIQEHYLPQVVDGTQTNKIKCRRCEKFNCKVTVIARGTLFLPSWVRSANPDEEMMTYVICNECGEQWYHSKWICT